MIMKLSFTFILSLLFVLGGIAQTVSSFEDFDIPVDSFWNGKDLSGDFVDGGLIFSNTYDTTYNFWSGGWAVSTMRDDTTAGFENIYGVITSKAARGEKFAVGTQNSTILVDGYDKVLFQGLWITNTTYAYLSMKNGDSFAKKFGGDTGDDPDFFKLRIYGIENHNIDSSKFVDFYLADFRDSVNTNDYILNSWRYVDLSSLGYVSGLSFELSSSDNSQWGMNTPAFYAIDKVKISHEVEDGEASFDVHNMAVDSFWFNKEGGDFGRDYFESDLFSIKSTYDTTYNYWSGGFALSTMRDDSTAGFSNLYGSIAAGAYDGITYAIGQNNASFYSRMADLEPVIKNIKICNSTYAYLSMKNGDSFAKKFGGDSGNDPDYFKLRIYGIYTSEGFVDSSRYVDFYLADFRFDDNSKDYIIDDWTEVNIEEPLGEPVGLAFELSSSDVGDYGMNTPAFFAIDKITYDIRSGTKSLTVNPGLEVYPNPASEYIEIKNIEIKNAGFEIYTSTGQKISKGKLNNNTKIDVSSLENGIYVLVVSNGKKKLTKQFIKIQK